MPARKTKSKQGPRGIPGPPGPAGPQGAAGSAGARGATGARGAVGTKGLHGLIGAHGRKGATGSRGASGASGVAAKEPAARHRILVSVSEHIDEIYTELTIQMKRMAQIQVQVDELRAKVKRLTE